MDDARKNRFRVRAWFRVLASATAVALAAVACVGEIKGRDLQGRGAVGGPNPGHPGSTGGGPAPIATGPGRLRQLTRAQFESTLRELLSDAITIGETQQDSTRDGFASIGATYASISARGVEQLDTAVLSLLRPIFEDPTRRSSLVGCTPKGVDDDACARQFIARFGRKAWRRTLSKIEEDRYVKVALSAAKLLGDAYQGLLHATSGLLESPNFVYRVEVGVPDPAAPGAYRYTPVELASRLSYLLWNSTPDDELLDAAESGKLDTPEGIAEMAGKLLASPRARTGLATFGRELVVLDGLIDAPKEDARMTPALRDAMIAEVERMFERLLKPGVDAMSLFDTLDTFANSELGRLYGLPNADKLGSTLQGVSLPAQGARSGLLGTGAVLALYSRQDTTSPTARGVFVREKLLCQPMPQPPDGVNTNLPGGTLTKRQQLEMHRTPGCSNCHDLFDPIGYGLEVFDWIGAYRTTEQGQAIDPSGSLDDFTYRDVRELNNHLRQMPEVRACFLRNLFRYASGHMETSADEPTLNTWSELFTRSNREFGKFLAALVASDAFRKVSPAPP